MPVKSPFGNEILVAILAATDAVFLPDRDVSDFDRHAVIADRRQKFQSAGVPWSSDKVLPGLDDAGRKQVQRGVEDLVRVGYMVSYQPRGTKTLGVKLTDAGEDLIRSLVGLPLLADARAMVDQIIGHERGDGAHHIYDRDWVRETFLAGVEYGDPAGSPPFIEAEDYLLPALIRGWVVSNCDVRRHAWYAVTLAGRNALKKWPGESARADRNDDVRLAYFQRIKVEQESLASASPECDREIGDIPMPVNV